MSKETFAGGRRDRLDAVWPPGVYGSVSLHRPHPGKTTSLWVWPSRAPHNQRQNHSPPLAPPNSLGRHNSVALVDASPALACCPSPRFAFRTLGSETLTHCVQQQQRDLAKGASTPDTILRVGTPAGLPGIASLAAPSRLQEQRRTRNGPPGPRAAPGFQPVVAVGLCRARRSQVVSVSLFARLRAASTRFQTDSGMGGMDSSTRKKREKATEEDEEEEDAT